VPKVLTGHRLRRGIVTQSPQVWYLARCVRSAKTGLDDVGISHIRRAFKKRPTNKLAGRAFSCTAPLARNAALPERIRVVPISDSSLQKAAETHFVAA